MDDSKVKLDNQICFPIYSASRLITKAYNPFLDEIGLTYTVAIKNSIRICFAKIFDLKLKSNFQPDFRNNYDSVALGADEEKNRNMEFC